MYVSKPDVVPLLQYTNLDAVAEGKGGGQGLLRGPPPLTAA